MNLRTVLICSVIISAVFPVQHPSAWAREPMTEVTLESGTTLEDSDGTLSPPEFPTRVAGPRSSGEGGEAVGATPVPLEPELKLNINDCVQMALLNNKEIKAQNFGVEAARWRKKETHLRGSPTIEYELISAPVPRDVDNAVGSFFTGNITYLQRGSIKLGAPLYTFGKLTLAQSLAQQGINAELEKRTEKQNDVVHKVRQLYYGILLAKDLRNLFRDAVNHLEEEIERRKNEEKVADPVKLVRLKLYRYEVLTRLTELEQKDYLAQEGLRIQMGLPRGSTYALVDQHLKPVDFELKSFDYYLNLSQKYRPKNKLLNIGLKAKETEFRLEKRKGAPDIGVGGFYEFGVTAQSIQGLVLTDDYNDPFNFNRVGVGLRIKGDFNPKRYRDNVQRSQAEYFKVAMEKSAADEGLELDLREAYSGVVHHNKNLLNARDAMKTARQYVFIAKTNVDIGIGGEDEYADSLQAYLVSRGRYLEAVFKYNVAVSNLIDKTGGTALNR